MKNFLTILLLISLLSSCNFVNINNENPEQHWLVKVNHSKAYDLYYKNIQEIIASDETKIHKSRNIMNNMDLFYSDIIDWEYEDYSLVISEYEKLLVLTMQSWIYIDFISLYDYKLLIFFNDYFDWNNYNEILWKLISKNLIFDFNEQVVLTEEQVYDWLDMVIKHEYCAN